MSIHPTAIIGQHVELGQNVEIEAYAVITGDTHIGDGTKVMSHACVGSNEGEVRIGKGNTIHQGAIIGGVPQDILYKGEKTKLIVGDNNIFREFVTINLGTKKENGVTRLGNNNLLMAYSHIAHDCELADHVVIANSCQFAGHVKVESYVTVGGVCAISQFVRIGKYVYIGGNSVFNKDILPYSIAEGRWGVMRSTNKIGLGRSGYSKEVIANIHKAMKYFIRGSLTVNEAIEKVKENCEMDDYLNYMIEFAANSEKGLAR